MLPIAHLLIPQEFAEYLQERLDGKYKAYVEQNRDISARKCRGILQTLFEKIEQGLTNGQYTRWDDMIKLQATVTLSSSSRPGGSQAFSEAVKHLEATYAAIPEGEKGPYGETALVQFMAEKVLY